MHHASNQHGLGWLDIIQKELLVHCIFFTIANKIFGSKLQDALTVTVTVRRGGYNEAIYVNSRFLHIHCRY